LTPQDGEKVVEKLHPSSFADTTLHDYLRGAGATKIVLVGYMYVETPAGPPARVMTDFG
jgi:nicotinamidase-related amidase